MQLPDVDTNGNYPAYAWPGGYPIYYLTKDNGILCAACASGNNGSEASDDPSTPDDWKLVACDIHHEGEPIVCDHCNAIIESAYGIPDATDN